MLLLATVGCAADDPDAEQRPRPAPSTTPDASTTPTPSAVPDRTQTLTPAPTPTTQPSRTRTPRPADPRWVFFTDDTKRHASPWFPGRHRVMIDFGCTDAPYYSPDPSCADGNGFHHGIDVAIPCGTPLTAGRAATVLDNSALGPAYGDNPVLLRVAGHDVVIGHTRKVRVDVSDTLARGERFALVSDAGAPDGCHLHFEVRRPGTGVSGAVDPAWLLELR